MSSISLWTGARGGRRQPSRNRAIRSQALHAMIATIIALVATVVGAMARYGIDTWF